jgi:hypothetical protein
MQALPKTATATVIAVQLTENNCGAEFGMADVLQPRRTQQQLQCTARSNVKAQL